ncbi:MAG: phosphate/phosphite/phosphonate ABC transporter substrate-binding protein [Bacteroidales bacterium]|nr:phosphate/phosphite/phosphonate ABC transporter substrate-binding protein [Bacteroidales bacterium]
MKTNRISFFLIALVVMSCMQKNENSGPQYGVAPAFIELPVYSFAIHPLHNPNKLIQSYQPLINYLNAHVSGYRFTLEASRDYSVFEEKYKAGKPDFLLPNPWQTLQAINCGYSVIAMAGDPDDFKGIFIVRNDGDIQTPSDLKGKSISYPSPTALAACIMPQYYLYCSGIDVVNDIENHYVGSQESSIMNVFLRRTAVGATWPPPWRAFQIDHPREAAELRVIWETEPLINNSVMVRHDIPQELKQQVQKLLLELCNTDQGKTILNGMETARFSMATNQDYDVVREYVARFEREVSKIEVK